jgi:hypothetical protein
VIFATPPATEVSKGPLKSPYEGLPDSGSATPWVVTVTFEASSSEPASWTTRPDDPMAPVAEMMAPVRLTNPPDCAITTGASFPLVVMVVGPRLLGATVVVAPVSVRRPNASGPEVEIEPPESVIWPPE